MNNEVPETIKCPKCGQDAEHITSVKNSKGTVDIYICEDEHKTEIPRRE
jgi:transcription elongation factor Elf1